MSNISKRCDKNPKLDVLLDAEKKYKIKIRENIKEFLHENSGGTPIKDTITVHGEEYEVRAFLSLDEKNGSYYIEKPLNYFLKKTKGDIVPIAIDSGDNYYCVNNKIGKVYYWVSDGDHYYPLTNSLNAFESLFG